MSTLQAFLSGHPDGVELRSLSANFSKEVQGLLNQAGYACGSADGIIGVKTQAAWANFKESNYLGLPDLIGSASYKALQEEAKARAAANAPYKDESAPAKLGRLVAIAGIGARNTTTPIVANGSFTWAEATHDGTRLPASREITNNMIHLATQLQKAREHVGKPFHVTSWYRPPEINRQVGGALYSQHLYGNAVDIYVDGFSGRDLASMLRWWEGGLGIYSHLPSILHLDVGGERRWGGAPWP